MEGAFFTARSSLKYTIKMPTSHQQNVHTEKHQFYYYTGIILGTATFGHSISFQYFNQKSHERDVH